MKNNASVLISSKDDVKLTSDAILPTGYSQWTNINSSSNQDDV